MHTGVHIVEVPALHAGPGAQIGPLVDRQNAAGGDQVGPELEHAVARHLNVDRAVLGVKPRMPSDRRRHRLLGEDLRLEREPARGHRDPLRHEASKRPARLTELAGHRYGRFGTLRDGPRRIERGAVDRVPSVVVQSQPDRAAGPR